MKKNIIILFAIIFSFVGITFTTNMSGNKVSANQCSISNRRGCCSHHGGVAGCSHGRQLCEDGTLSPTCRC